MKDCFSVRLTGNYKQLQVFIIALFIFLGPFLGCSDDEVNANTNCETQEAVIAVHCTAVGLGAICNVQENAEQRVSLIRSFIDPIRFYPDNSGYFYVYDYNCVNIAHATQKDLVGKNLYDYQDCKGKYVIRELAAMAKKGGGFVSYHWVKPGSEGEQLKMGYVEPIPGTDYFIGTGVYSGTQTKMDTEK